MTELDEKLEAYCPSCAELVEKDKENYVVSEKRK